MGKKVSYKESEQPLKQQVVSPINLRVEYLRSSWSSSVMASTKAGPSSPGSGWEWQAVDTVPAQHWGEAVPNTHCPLLQVPGTRGAAGANGSSATMGINLQRLPSHGRCTSTMPALGRTPGLMVLSLTLPSPRTVPTFQHRMPRNCLNSEQRCLEPAHPPGYRVTAGTNTSVQIPADWEGLKSQPMSKESLFLNTVSHAHALAMLSYIISTDRGEQPVLSHPLYLYHLKQQLK